MEGPGIVVTHALAPEAGPARDEWHLWYDDEHVPSRLGVPGITGASRFRDQADPDHFATMYEFASLDALGAPEYVALRSEANRSERDRRIMASSKPTSRRVYRQVGWDACKAGYVPGTAPIVLAVGMTMPEDVHDELIEWYEMEHVPMLLRVDGWQRIRRFLHVDGDGFVSFTLCEIASHDVWDDPVKLAAATPWRDALAEKRIGYERIVWERWRDFGPGTPLGDR